MTRYYVDGEVTFFDSKSGGRSLMPIGDGYAPYIVLKEGMNPLAVRFYGLPNPAGRFGAQCPVKVELTYHPQIDYSMLRVGERFHLSEGKKIVGLITIFSQIYKI